MALSQSDTDNSHVLAHLKPGDLVEFPRGNYSHWAVYAGNEEVIHLYGDGNDSINAKSRPEHLFTCCGVKYPKTFVRKDNFWDVVKTSTARKNNDNDSSWSAFKPQEILERAKYYVGSYGYNLITANCEHFAKWCRYGQWKSDQVDGFLACLTGLAVGGTVALGIGALAALATSSGSSEVAAGSSEAAAGSDSD